MQEVSSRRSNRERSDTTRDALVSASRALFVEKGYAGATTPAIVTAARVTRGALYHHFLDKRDLFRAVLEHEARTVADEIDAAAPPDLSPREAVMAGSEAYLDAMTVPGRTRLLLIDGPAVLGAAEIDALDAAHAGRALLEGIEAVLAESGDAALHAAMLASVLAAAFDRAAIAIDAGADALAFKSTMSMVLARVLTPQPDARQHRSNIDGTAVEHGL